MKRLTQDKKVPIVGMAFQALMCLVTVVALWLFVEDDSTRVVVVVIGVVIIGFWLSWIREIYRG